MRALIFNKQLIKTVEAMNVIVSERRDFMQRMYATFHLNDQCKNYIDPKEAFDYKSLQVRSITGAMALLIAMLVLGMLICVVEFVFSLFSTNDKNVKVFLALRIDIRAM